MSRAWIAFYMGDYDKDTSDLTTLEHGAYFLLLKVCWTHGRIPLEPAKRASIARMTLKQWEKIAPSIDRFFEEDGTQRRATREIEKADITRLKRAMSGKVGGMRSRISRAIAKGEAIKREAKSKQSFKQNTKPDEATLNRNISTSENLAAREGEKSPGGSLATAHPEGALRSPPIEESVEPQRLSPLVAKLLKIG